MKHYIKVFLASLIAFSLIIFSALFSYVKFFNPQDSDTGDKSYEWDQEDDKNAADDTPLEKAMRESERINVMLIGLEGTRSDTIMLASYDRESKKADIISIPRDTYFPREGYSKYSDFQKINAIFGSEDEGYAALASAIEKITGIHIDKYMSVDYDGVRAAVDAIGGVEIDVPFHMKYTDPYDKPPLYIDIPKGKQIIYGDKAMEFLRFRKGDPGYPGYAEGDVGRIETQQQFVKSAIKKSLSLKLPSVINAVYPYVETNFTLTDLLSLAKDAIGFSTENLSTRILPGKAAYMGNLSFYIPDGQEITKMVYELYGVPLTAESDSEKKTE
jgi:LCP family protein required for cell wall assembly